MSNEEIKIQVQEIVKGLTVKDACELLFSVIFRIKETAIVKSFVD